MRIMLDAGHGGTDSGAIGVSIIEKDYTLKVVKKLKEKLNNYVCDVFLTRDTDTHISLMNRCNLSNVNNCDVFISIHCNSFTDKNANGFESFSINGESTLQKNIHKSIMNRVSIKDRGIKKENFYVLRNTYAKAILLELGFVSNINDSKILEKDIDKFVDGIIDGLILTYNLKLKENKEIMYTIQVGCFKNKNNAQVLANELRSKGYECIIKASV